MMLRCAGQLRPAGRWSGLPVTTYLVGRGQGGRKGQSLIRRAEQRRQAKADKNHAASRTNLSWCKYLFAPAWSSLVVELVVGPLHQTCCTSLLMQMAGCADSLQGAYQTVHRDIRHLLYLVMRRGRGRTAKMVHCGLIETNVCAQDGTPHHMTAATSASQLLW